MASQLPADQDPVSLRTVSNSFLAAVPGAVPALEAQPVIEVRTVLVHGDCLLLASLYTELTAGTRGCRDQGFGLPDDGEIGNLGLGAVVGTSRQGDLKLMMEKNRPVVATGQKTLQPLALGYFRQPLGV